MVGYYSRRGDNPDVGWVISCVCQFALHTTPISVLLLPYI